MFYKGYGFEEDLNSVLDYVRHMQIPWRPQPPAPDSDSDYSDSDSEDEGHHHHLLTYILH